MDQYNKLVRIYNTLCEIEVKGESVIALAECLVAFKNVLIEMSNNSNKEQEYNG